MQDFSVIANDLPWDSQFFNKKIGKVVVGKDYSNLNLTIKNIKDYDLVYLFSEEALVKFNNDLVDIRITLSARSSSLVYQSGNCEVRPFEIESDSFEELLSLVLRSGNVSRFNKDKMFSKKDYLRLYTYWIKKDIDNIESNKVFVCNNGDKLSGFITIEDVHEESPKIGLLAVQEDSEGKGIATLLVNKAKEYCLENKKFFLKVSTQFENKRAMAFYEKNDFNIIEKTFIYHIWNH